jgi:DNA-binding NarL/FixJ family response regulator
MRVLLVNDHRVVADAITRLLQAEPDIDVIGAVTSLRDLGTSVPDGIDLCLLSYLLPDGNGADGTRLLRSRAPHVKVVVLSRINDPRAAARVARAGADAFVHGSATWDELVSTLRDVHAGRGGFDATGSSAGIRARRAQRRRPGAVGSDHLTPRELDVLRALALGRTTTQMCAEFGIGQNTVRTHVQNIIGKLRVHSRLEAVALAMRERLI